MKLFNLLILILCSVGLVNSLLIDNMPATLAWMVCIFLVAEVLELLDKMHQMRKRYEYELRYRQQNLNRTKNTATAKRPSEIPIHNTTP